MEAKGGLAVSEKLQELEAGLRDYYGALNEIKAGLNVKLPERPQALVEYERCKTLNLPLVAGGTQDQPHIWLQELATVIDTEALFTALEQRQKESLTDTPQ